MAKMRQSVETVYNQECPPDFSNHPHDLINYPQIPIEFLAASCAHYKDILDDPADLAANALNMLRAVYFSREELMNTLKWSTGAYVRVYYAVLPDKDGRNTGKHFMFMVPANSDGRPIVDEHVLFAQCIGENPPCDKPTGTDIFMGNR